MSIMPGQKHLFPAAVHPHEHQLRHQEQYHVNHARTETVHPHEHQLRHQEQYHVNHVKTEKYRKSAIPHIQRLLNR